MREEEGGRENIRHLTKVEVLDPRLDPNRGHHYKRKYDNSRNKTPADLLWCCSKLVERRSGLRPDEWAYGPPAFYFK